eukprot:CAMPEP_0183788912 /NCGR_PEP_ID=MMETSP0803_2-20130417/57_1 /TAXON_ID=195967 /ORGANISM="Crustomastix stigmata, Strain CCMP3273" /LENGTH=1256 /DNA_ID=CAMNT_0026033063 /DNA_START=154 /DNA_END=3921 /DNA_ORIENTATION=+
MDTGSRSLSKVTSEQQNLIRDCVASRENGTSPGSVKSKIMFGRMETSCTQAELRRSAHSHIRKEGEVYKYLQRCRSRAATERNMKINTNSALNVQLTKTAIEENNVARARMRDNCLLTSTCLKGLNVARSRVHNTATVDILQHKRTVDSLSREAVQASVEAAVKLRTKQEVQKHETQELIGQGENPYEIFRQRMIFEQLDKERRRVLKERHNTYLHIAQRMLREENNYQRWLGEVKAELVYAEKHARETSVLAREERVQNYMITHTKDGSDILDPTGRVPVFPSHATTVKTWAFGLGSADARIVAAVQEHYNEVPCELLLNAPKCKPSKFSAKTMHPITTKARGILREHAGRSITDGSETLCTPTPQKQTSMKLRAEKKINVQRLKSKFDSFLASPEQVIFTDCEVGKACVQTVELTNVSCTFNTFKVLDLPDKIKDFFAVEYTPPGELSSGITSSIKLTFEPRLLEDIATELPLLTRSGYLTIPVVCNMKKPTVSVTASNVHFGAVMIGETCSRCITVVNSGALDVDFQVVAVTDNGPADFSIQTCGIAKGYARTAVKVKFTPQTEGMQEVELCLKFKHASVPDYSVSLCAIGSPLQLQLDRVVVDFNCCVHDQVYQAMLSLQNRSNSALKCCIVHHKKFDKFVEFTPDIVYCQGGSSATFHIKFAPTEDLCNQFPHCMDDTTRFIELPYSVGVPGQRSCINFTVRARLTSSDLVFTPSSLNFGNCHVGTTNSADLQVTNMSSLPQVYGFVDLPRGLSLQPSSGFGTIFPGETVNCTAQYAPEVPVSLPPLLFTCKTLFNRSFLVRCFSRRVHIPLAFSSNHIRLAATCSQDITTASFSVSNVSRAPQTFEIVVPESCGLKLSPVVETLLPGQTIRVQIDYSPVDTKEPPIDICHTENRLPSAESYDSQQYKSRLHKLLLPCFIKGIKDSTYVEVEAVVKPEMVSVEGLDKSCTRTCNGYYTLNFECMPLGKHAVRTIVLRNLGNKVLTIKAEALDHEGTFSLLNAVRPICPRDALCLKLNFNPSANIKYFGMLVLHVNSSKIRVALVGEGISPQLTLEPNFSNKLLDLGNVRLGSYACSDLQLVNPSPFALGYRAEVHLNEQNKTGLMPFICQPAGGTIPAGGQQALKVIFSPSEMFALQGTDCDISSKLIVTTPYENNRLLLSLKARCWEHGMFITGGDGLTRFCDSRLEHISLQKLPGASREKWEINIVFKDVVEYGQSGSRTIQIGSLPGSGKVTDFDIQPLSHDTMRQGW